MNVKRVSNLLQYLIQYVKTLTTPLNPIKHKHKQAWNYMHVHIIPCFMLLHVYETCTEVKTAMQYVSQTGIITSCSKIKIKLKLTGEQQSTKETQYMK